MKEKLKLMMGILVVLLLLGGIGFVTYQGIAKETDKQNNPVVTFELQDQGTIKMELYPEYAPNTVANVIALIQAGYYNNKVLFGKDDICLYMGRSAEGETDMPKVSQIDSSVEAGSEADYEYEINGEFIVNGFEKNTLRHEKGVISLNRYDYSSYGLTEESYNSGRAQFSIMMDNASTLNGVYCAFGKVIEGMDVLENIYQTAQIASSEEKAEGENASEEDEGSIKEFATMPVITSATVETYGVNYGKPEVHKVFDIQAYVTDLYSRYYSN